MITKKYLYLMITIGILLLTTNCNSKKNSEKPLDRNEIKAVKKDSLNSLNINEIKAVKEWLKLNNTGYSVNDKSMVTIDLDFDAYGKKPDSFLSKWDLNKNGIEEIFVSAISDENKNKTALFILEPNKGKLVQLFFEALPFSYFFLDEKISQGELLVYLVFRAYSDYSSPIIFDTNQRKYQIENDSEDESHY